MKVRITRTYSEDFDVDPEQYRQLMQWQREARDGNYDSAVELSDFYHFNQCGIPVEDRITVRKVK